MSVSNRLSYSKGKDLWDTFLHLHFPIITCAGEEPVHLGIPCHRIYRAGVVTFESRDKVSCMSFPDIDA